ncbi:dienelactone hydrolase family protein [Scleromatobacter humisilvae]|uniref:Dienelactone hydrolase family protein n=1 Tax=Scleromatobacter humisilvae TaxID=2897159 RepID=A0A9X2BZN8_9BURK|nr:dienelactone hydrolase family protein [Scleromatobacter humisilvae]MCK9685576.1 dienelactone hydrolase family protein [Scleromatobacter humisilvae]
MPRSIRSFIPALLLGFTVWSAAAAPRATHFPSADGTTELVGYLFEPAGAGPHPAIVMLHGRAGPYSSNASAGCTLVAPGQASPCNAATLSRRHEMWGEYWAAHGYVALLVDSFGPRGRAHGYGRFTHDDPDRDAVNELTVRPLDAEGALAWLGARADVTPARVMLQGWSNGASTALNTMQRQAAGASATKALRFRAALVFYPGCGPKALLSQRPGFDAPLWAFLGSDDEEVSPETCAKVLAKASGGPVAVTTYAGATHDFDDPGKARQAVAGNRAAKDDAMTRAAALLDAVGR